jgi:alpha-N-arabinofuranosidase
MSCVTDATRLSVLLAEPIATINPALHGHFAEHLGELIYPGIWVGPDSEVPNVDGIRTDVVEALAPLEIPVLRWPGGCFADDYNWRDGIGPRDRRPQRLNPFWGMAAESSAFGTHEFMAFARAIGATPYFAGSLGSGSPRELRDWIEYSNHPSGSTLSDERRANGAEDPFGIELWGIGNENWGCGGRMTPEAYAEAYARYRTFAFPFGGTPITGIAAGPNGADWAWTTRFFDRLETGTIGSGRRVNSVQGFAAHYYCQTAGTATEYTDSQWLELLTKASVVDGIITGHRALMDRYDPDRKIGLVLDEWGTWHPVEEGKPAGGLYQQNTIRDALVAAISLDTFHNHADKLVMANIAQLINVLQAVLLVDETRVVKTPTYHVFDMYAPHKGGQAVRLVNGSAVISNGEASGEQCRTRYIDGRRAELRRVTGSASVTGDRLCVTLVNSDPRQPVAVDIDTWGGRVLDASAVSLVTDDIHDHNTFEEPEKVTVGESYEVPVLDGHAQFDLPAASVTRMFLTLG